MIYQYHHAPCTIFNYFTLLYFHHTHLKNQTFSIPAPPGMAIVNPQMKQIVVTLNENLTSNEYVMTPRNPTLSLWSARCPVLSGNIFTPFFFSIFQFRILTSYFMVEVKAIILKCCCLSLTNSVTLLVSASIFSSTTEQVSSSSERPVSLYVPAFFYLSKAMPLLYCTSLTAPFIGLIGLISSTHKLGTRSPISNTLQTRKATLMSPYPAGAPSCSPYSSGQLQTSGLSPLPFTVTLSHFAPVPTLFWFLPSPLQDSSSQCPR